MDLNDAEKVQLTAILGVSKEQLDAELEKYQAAATEEYVRLILGQRVFTRGTDFREYRLLLLAKHVFRALPTDAQVSALFQTTTSQSRALLRAVMSKYQYELYDIIRGSLRTALESAKVDDNNEGGKLLVLSDVIAQRLNSEVSAIDGTLRPLIRQPETVSSYMVDAGTYEKLVERFKA